MSATETPTDIAESSRKAIDTVDPTRDVVEIVLTERMLRA